MNKFLQTFILVVSIILMIGCTINNSNNINQKKEDKIIKEIKNVDSNLEHNLPLGIDSVKLMSSGKVILLTNDELIPNEEVNNMNLMESCLYLEKLNMLDKLSNSNVGDNNE